MVVTSNCVSISLSYIFYIFKHTNSLEKGFFCKCFHWSERPLQKNFLQIKIEEDLKIRLAPITLKYFKKQRETAATLRVFARWARVDHPPLPAAFHKNKSHIVQQRDPCLRYSALTFSAVKIPKILRILYEWRTTIVTLIITYLHLSTPCWTRLHAETTAGTLNSEHARSS